MAFAFGNAQDIGAREAQQDSFGFSDPSDAGFREHGGFLAVVADGMGGMANGDLASRTAVRMFLAAYSAKPAEEDIPSALRRTITVANREVCALGQGDLGTTLVAAVLHSTGLYWVSVGDSGLFLYREGELTLLNTPHVYARELDARAAAGEITREQAQSDPQRESLTSYLGMLQMPLIDLAQRPLPVQEDDCILLASDGLFKTLSADEMVAGMRGRMQERCRRLVRATLEKKQPYQDNVTILAISQREQVEAAAFAPAAPPVIRRPAPRRAPVRLIAFLAAALALLAGYFFRGYFRPEEPPGKPARYEPPGPHDLPAGKFDREKLPASNVPAPENVRNPAEPPVTGAREGAVASPGKSAAEGDKK